jgi:hypothetical protein
MAMAASFVATHVYFAGLPEGEEGVIAEAFAWKLVGGLSGAWLVFFLAFLWEMKHSYWHTFFSVETGGAWMRSRFLRGETDELRAEIFDFNKNMWTEIREDVKQWCLANWEKWDDEKPRWFVSSQSQSPTRPCQA